uniref:Uncharacterized protein n=1 Tax=Setaria italica TaxID=4555 RepID=K3XTL8_SETIT
MRKGSFGPTNIRGFWSAIGRSCYLLPVGVGISGVCPAVSFWLIS